MDQNKVHLEILQTTSDPQPTGLGFNGHFDWKLENPVIEEEVAIIDFFADVLHTHPDEIIDELYQGQAFYHSNELEEIIIQLDGVVPVDPVFPNLLSKFEEKSHANRI